MVICADLAAKVVPADGVSPDGYADGYAGANFALLYFTLRVIHGW